MQNKIELFHIDCLMYMKRIADKYFDLAVVDPPYGTKLFLRKKSCNNYVVSKEHLIDNKPNSEYFEELFRISRNQIIWGGNYFIEHLYDTMCFLVWDKIAYDRLQADCELAWTSFQKGSKVFRYKWIGSLQGDGINKEKRIHPHQKPIVLYKWIYKNFTKPKQKVFDSHLGSGSAAIAAFYSDINFVGCEINENYYRLALNRCKEETNQISLF